MSETVELVRRSLADGTRETFDRRVRAGAAFIREELNDGSLNNADPTIGLELECYVVDDDGRLATLPEGCLDDTPVNRELGRHNVEINTPPTVLSEAGVRAQADSVRNHLAAGRRVAEAHGRRIVLDAMWTIPPAAGTRSYLSAVVESEGVVLAANMHEAARYHALDNDVLRHAGGEVELDLPGVRESFPSILVESLATSIQPHLQVPDVGTFPDYYNAAIRTLGPVLALATNSPFLPADLYDDADPATVLETTFHELRVPVFEQSINAGQDRGKVRFPRDVETASDVVDRVAEDGTLVPFLREWVDGDAAGGAEKAERAGTDRLSGAEGAERAGTDRLSGAEKAERAGTDRSSGAEGAAVEQESPPDGAGEYTDAFWEFSHKHGTYWRWLRGVVGGDYVDEHNDERSLRIEYRPLPTQPSVTDLVGLQCLVAGLLRGIVAAEHPLASLDWSDARATFYGVVEDGLDAEIHWVTADGDHATEPAVVYDEVFSLARRGLADSGVSKDTRERYLRPIERRFQERITPSAWKLDRVRQAVEGGATLAEGIEAMQREYIQRSAGGEPFVEWS